jgi:hypothetical protein
LAKEAASLPEYTSYIVVHDAHDDQLETQRVVSFSSTPPSSPSVVVALPIVGS